MLMMRFYNVAIDNTGNGLQIKSEAEMQQIESWVGTANKLSINYSKSNQAYILFSNPINTDEKDNIICIRASNGTIAE